MHHEPSIPVLEAYLGEIKKHNIDGIVAIGAGSLLHIAKVSP